MEGDPRTPHLALAPRATPQPASALRIQVGCHGHELERNGCYVTRFDFEDDDVHHGPDCHLHPDEEVTK